MKSIFFRHSIPSCVISDNSPQFLTTTFSSFVKEYGFTHYTRSLRYLQTNGEVCTYIERGVRSIKTPLKTAKDNLEDLYLAMHMLI